MSLGLHPAQALAACDSFDPLCAVKLDYAAAYDCGGRKRTPGRVDALADSQPPIAST